MKLISIVSVGVATVGMTCLVGYASAADSAPVDLTSDSMLVAQDSTFAPGGRGGGTAGETGRHDKGTPAGRKKQGTPGDTMPNKQKPGTEKNTGSGGKYRIGQREDWDEFREPWWRKWTQQWCWKWR